MTLLGIQITNGVLSPDDNALSFTDLFRCLHQAVVHLGEIFEPREIQLNLLRYCCSAVSLECVIERFFLFKEGNSQLRHRVSGETEVFSH